jgi:uncharacterized protein (TIGR02246 family)
MKRMVAQRLVERMASAWMQRDVSAIVALFSEEGQFITPGSVSHGQAAIAATVTKFFVRPIAVKVTITRLLVDGSHGAIEWVWRETNSTSGAERIMEDAIIFAVRDSKLVYWREYFDPTQTRAL